MISFGLKLLLGGWGRLLSAITALWGWATKNPVAALCVVLAASTVWFWHGKGKAQADAAIQRAGWVAEVKLRIGDQKRYRDAQAEAERLAVAAKAKTEARYAELAKDADNAKLETLRAASDRFAISRRRFVRPEQPATAVSTTGATAAPAESDPAPDRDGPGAETVLLTRPEYDQFVSNTLRLEAVRRWGETLVAEGLAVKGE